MDYCKCPVKTRLDSSIKVMASQIDTVKRAHFHAVLQQYLLECRNFIVEETEISVFQCFTFVIIIFRLLCYRCVPLAVGRVIDLKREIIPVATKALLGYFYNKGMPSSSRMIYEILDKLLQKVH